MLLINMAKRNLMFLMNKKMKKRILISVIIISLLIIFGTLFINIYMINSVKDNIVSINKINSINNVDAIIVLGCKVDGNYPSVMLKNRLDKGIDVYHTLNSKIILSGDHGRNEYDEVNVMRDYLLTKEIDTKDIFLDHAGFSTYDSIYRAKFIFNAKKIVIVTQKYHISRALYIAKELGIEAYGVIADDIPYKGIMFKNEIREILSRDKNFFKVLIKPKSKYLGETISLDGDSNLTLD